MRQPARLHRRCLGADAGAHDAFRRGRPDPAHLVVGCDFRRDLDLDQKARRIAAPQSVAFQAERRIENLDAVLLHPLLEIGQILGEAAERDVMQLLARALDHPAPALIAAEGAQFEPVARIAHVEAEIGIEALGLLQIGNRQHELIERMYADFAFMHPALNVSACRRHGFRPVPVVVAARLRVGSAPYLI